MTWRGVVQWAAANGMLAAVLGAAAVVARRSLNRLHVKVDHLIKNQPVQKGVSVMPWILTLEGDLTDLATEEIARVEQALVAKISDLVEEFRSTVTKGNFTGTQVTADLAPAPPIPTASIPEVAVPTPAVPAAPAPVETPPVPVEAPVEVAPPAAPTPAPAAPTPPPVAVPPVETVPSASEPPAQTAP